MNQGDAVKVVGGSFAIKGKMGLVEKVEGNMALVRTSETQVVNVLVNELELVSQMELMLYQQQSLGWGK